MPRETKLERQLRQSVEEATFINVLKRAGNIVEKEVLVPNSDGRKWRVDYLVMKAHPHHFGRSLIVALEIQGIGFGHHRFAAIMKTYEKHNAIAANRWPLVQVTRKQVANGEALEALARCGVRVIALDSWRKQAHMDDVVFQRNVRTEDLCKKTD